MISEVYKPFSPGIYFRKLKEHHQCPPLSNPSSPGPRQPSRFFQTFLCLVWNSGATSTFLRCGSAQWQCILFQKGFLYKCTYMRGTTMKVKIHRQCTPRLSLYLWTVLKCTVRDETARLKVATRPTKSSSICVDHAKGFRPWTLLAFACIMSKRTSAAEWYFGLRRNLGIFCPYARVAQTW